MLQFIILNSSETRAYAIKLSIKVFMFNLECIFREILRIGLWSKRKDLFFKFVALATLFSGTVSIVTLAALSIHRLMTVKNIPGWKIATFQQSTG